MDLDRIEKLLAKYWECETSVEEEKELKNFFNNEEVPEKWKSLIPLFQYYEREKAEGGLDRFFDERVIAQIEEIDKPAFKKAPTEGKVRKMINDALKIAAVILVIATSVYFVRENIKEKEEVLVEAVEDPQEAFEEAKKALMMLSRNFNKGKKEASKMSVFHEAQEQVKNQTETL